MGGFSDVDVAVVVSGGGGGVDDVAAVSDGDGRDGGGEGGGAGRVRGEPPASGIAEPVGVRGRGLWRARADVALRFQPGRIHVRS